MIENKIDKKKWLTISEFEQLTELNNKTIMSAIQRSMIPSDCICRKNNDAPATSILFDDLEPIEVEKKKTTLPYYINPHTAAEYWYRNLNPTRHDSFEIKEKLKNYIITYNPGFMEMNKDDPPGIAGDVDNMSYKEAVRLEKVSKAKIAELELKEKEGTLVSKSFVFDQLFAFGNELRNALLSIPDREIDKIIVNHNDRTKAHTILYDAISKELEKLSNINLK